MMNQEADRGATPLLDRKTTVYLVIAFFFVAPRDWLISLAGSFNKPEEAMEMAIEGGDPLRRLVFLSLAGVGLYGLWALRKRHLSLQSFPLAVFMGFAGWAATSMMWSGDWLFTVRRLSVSVFVCIGAAWVATKASAEAIPRFVLVASGAYLCVGVAAELVLGTLQISPNYRFSGTLHPNQQGVNCALLLIAAVALISADRRRRSLYVVPLAGGLCFLLMTESRTALISFVVSHLVFWAVHLRVYTKQLLVVAVLALLTAATLATVMFLPTSSVLTSWIDLGRNDSDLGTLTGRTLLWRELWPYVKDRPATGYGYNSFWTPVRVSDMADAMGNGASEAMSEGHSTYLDVMLGVGIIGLVLFTTSMLIGLRRSVAFLRWQYSSGSVFCLMLIVFCSLHGLTESALVYNAFLEFVFVWCVFAVCVNHLPRRREPAVQIAGFHWQGGQVRVREP
jgi:exopolysaccharide production protein ExoQ